MELKFKSSEDYRIISNLCSSISFNKLNQFFGHSGVWSKVSTLLF